MKKLLTLTAAAFLFLWATPVYSQEAQPDVVPTVDVEAATAPEAPEAAEAAAPEAAEAAVTEEPEAPEAAVTEEPEAPAETPATAPETPAAEEAGEVPAPSEKMPETPEELGETVDKALLAAEGGYWTVFAGFLIMVLIWILRRLGLMQKWTKAVPWLALVVGGIITFAAYLASGYPVETSILYAFFAGGGAVSMWELVFKHIDGGKVKAEVKAEAKAEVKAEAKAEG